MEPAFPNSAYVALSLLLGLMIRGAWRGYRRGPLRQLAGPAALTAGITAGWAFGPEAGHAALEGSDFPWLLRGATGICVLGAVTGLVTYSACWWLGRRPEGSDEAESPVAGAFVGCWTGIMYFVLLVMTLFSWASIEECLQGPTEGEAWPVRIRKELIESGLGSELRDWSPIPDRHRILISRSRRVMADPAARRRLMAMPEIRGLASHPTVYQAWQDADIRKALNNNDLNKVIDHPKVRAALADEALQREIEKVDLAGLMGKALEKPQK